MKKKLMSLLLVQAMICGLAACGTNEAPTTETSVVKEEASKEASNESSEEVSTEPVTITMYPRNANITSGTVGGWLGEWLLEQGIILEVWAYSDEKASAILASGELPDIMYFPKNTTDIEALVQSGLLLELDEHMDKMPAIANDEKMQVAVNYVKEYVANGSSALLPIGVGGRQIHADLGWQGLKVNWDVYKEVGYPEFSSLEELVPILKQMQEAHPETEDGIKAYAMRNCGDQDGSYFASMQSIYNISGYHYNELPYFIEVELENTSFDYILEEDSLYKEGLKFYNQMYREGLMDPDSINAEYLGQHKMNEADASVATWASVPGYEYAGYYPVYYDDFKIGYNFQGSIYGESCYVGVSADTENLDTVLKFVNMMADPDALLYMVSGPEGEMWEFDAEGNVVLTEKGFGWWAKGEMATFENGEEYVLFNNGWIKNSGEFTSYGAPADLATSAEILAAKAESEDMKDWQAHYGYDNVIELLKDKGQIIENPEYNKFNKFAGTPSDEQSLIISAAKDIIVDGSWKMVYAESEAELEQIWAETVKECEELGIKDIYDWRVAELQKAMEIAASLAK